MMSFQRKSRRLVGACLVVSFCISGLGLGAAIAETVPATVVMTNGEVYRGELSGLDPTSRLVAAIPPHIGPPATLDIPVSEIRQITLDFPRLVIETPDRVFIGPWGAFRGIPEGLTIDTDRGSFPLVTAAIRAMALHEATLHPVPREWLGDAFLEMPAILIESATEADAAIAPAFTADSSFEDDATIIDLTTPIFGGTNAVETTEEPASASSWWVLLILAAVVVAVVLLASGSPGS